MVGHPRISQRSALSLVGQPAWSGLFGTSKTKIELLGGVDASACPETPSITTFHGEMFTKPRPDLDSLSSQVFYHQVHKNCTFSIPKYEPPCAVCIHSINPIAFYFSFPKSPKVYLVWLRQTAQQQRQPQTDRSICGIVNLYINSLMAWFFEN